MKREKRARVINEKWLQAKPSWLHALRSTMTFKTSKSTPFTARKISSGQLFIHTNFTTQLYQSRRWIRSKWNWSSALSTTEFPMALQSFSTQKKIVSIYRLRELASSLKANSTMAPSHASVQLAWGTVSLKWRTEDQVRGHSDLTSTDKVGQDMWIHWQRRVMWVDGKSTQGNCQQMHSCMEKVRGGWMMHAHSLASGRWTQWKLDNSLSFKKMELLPFLRSSTMRKMIERMILNLIIKHQLANKRYLKVRNLRKSKSKETSEDAEDFQKRALRYAKPIKTKASWPRQWSLRVMT